MDPEEVGSSVVVAVLDVGAHPFVSMLDHPSTKVQLSTAQCTILVQCCGEYPNLWTWLM